jgi:anti-sigma regulatory factor (Ser/Thr protein kinase)
MSMEADPGCLQEARDWAFQVAAAAGLSEPECFQVKLAMSEAVSNAIKHGSRTRSDCIRIEAFERDGVLVFDVRDEGTSFVAPLSRATDQDESGRGLEVLDLMMDEVYVRSGAQGSVLRFAKRLAG